MHRRALYTVAAGPPATAAPPPACPCSRGFHAGRPGAACAAGHRHRAEAAGPAAGRAHLGARHRVRPQARAGPSPLGCPLAAARSLPPHSSSAPPACLPPPAHCLFLLMLRLPPGPRRRVEAVLKGCGAALVWVSHDPGQPARVGGRVLNLPLGHESGALLVWLPCAHAIFCVPVLWWRGLPARPLESSRAERLPERLQRLAPSPCPRSRGHAAAGRVAAADPGLCVPRQHARLLALAPEAGLAAGSQRQRI